MFSVSAELKRPKQKGMNNELIIVKENVIETQTRQWALTTMSQPDDDNVIYFLPVYQVKEYMIPEIELFVKYR